MTISPRSVLASQTSEPKPARHAADLGFHETLGKARGPVLLTVPRPDGGKLDLRKSDLTEEAQDQIAKIEKTAAQVEGVLIRQLLQELDKISPVGGKGPMRDLAVDAFQVALADTATRGSGFGLARSIARQASAPLLLSEAARIILAQTPTQAPTGAATKDLSHDSAGLDRPNIEDRKVDR